jgi:predicted aspartyl protease
MSSLGCPH